ncbi:putative disease resistance protein RGA1 [Cornus florida]|uniref:putative disease resistance protein RGA1 n=1 Tax=Cornus florida TaxID=4283 RepID=UPI00289E76C4|nr:putative disease resistance protein RGA1 [Cornus florida]
MESLSDNIVVSPIFYFFSEGFVVSPILDDLLGKLDSLFDGAGNRSSRAKQTRQLRRVIEEILAEVLIVERESKTGITTLLFLADVQKAAYVADDMLDGVSKNEVSMMMNVSMSDPLHSVLYLILQDFLRIENIYKIHDKDMTSSAPVIREHFHCRSSPNLSAVDELLQSKKVFGRDKDKKKMLGLLIQDNNQMQLSVISILGVDGIGKTTLARMLYDDEKVLKHFDLRVWVSFDAQDFDEVKIAKGIIESVTGFPLEPEEMGELSDLVIAALGSKRSLIVLDDIKIGDNKDIEGCLEILKSLSAASALGSKVIVTTPTLHVEDDHIAANVEHYELKKLSYVNSWYMFNYLASDSSNAISNPKMSMVIRILQSCRGLPLLLDLIGRLLRIEKEKRDLASFEKFLYFGLLIPRKASVSCEIGNPLVLSYTHLPSHLKKCFAYCSIFTKGHALSKEKLIHMWIAEGLIQSFDGKRTLEDIGNDYFRELVSRSFFTELSSNDSGDIIECRMHGIIHYFAQVVAGSMMEKEAGVECRQSRDMRQVSLAFSCGLSTIPRALDIPKYVRTLLLLSGNFSGTLDHSFFRFKGLRVLDLSCSGIGKLSSHIRNLQHLRYLDLSHTFIKKLPSSIASLTHLQTLKLFGCYRLEVLPKRIHNLTNLRHLDIVLCHSLSHMPSGIGLLTSLQSMPVFVLGKNRGCAHLGELRRLNLTGKLEIKNLQNENRLEEAHQAKLYHKEKLHHLGLSWGHDNVDQCSKISSALLLENLCPHPKLKVLDITGNGDIKFPSWMKDSTIRNLVKLSMRNCSCEELPPLGQLPYLKELCVKGMPELKSIGQEFYGKESVNGFPSLEKFELSDMLNLKEWLETHMEASTSSSTTKQVFPCLNTLTVEGCPQLQRIPILPVLKDLVMWNSNEKLPCSLAHLTSLSSLVINEFTEGCSFYNQGNFNSVKKLMIYNSRILDNKLDDDGMREFTSLEHLGILRCSELMYLPMGFRYLTSLQKLDIVECSDLKFIPEIMESLTSLRELIIDDCPGLESLPTDLPKLTRLQKLIIKRCQKLSKLPQGLEVTYELQFLLITGCPQLERRLQKETGEDWPMIAHIRCIIIGHHL